MPHIATGAASMKARRVRKGGQFTNAAWTGELISHGIRLSMDGKGRWTDNAFIERLWRPLKYE